jgi:tetratricopeptide (TPR) repeat protein
VTSDEQRKRRAANRSAGGDARAPAPGLLKARASPGGKPGSSLVTRHSSLLSWLCIFLVIFFGALSAFPQQTAPAPGAETEAILKAEEALDAKNYTAAIAILKEQQARGSANVRVYFDLAFALSMAGERAAAIEAYRQALSIEPSLPEANLNLAILLLDGRQPGEAVPLLEKVLAARPRDLRAQVLLANALAGSGDRERATAEYRQALELDPNSAEALLGLGRVLAAQGQFAEAEKQLRRAAELQPARVEARLEIGSVLEATGRLDEARALYSELAAQNPDNAAVHRRLGRALVAAKRYAEAASELERAARLAPAPDDERNLAIAYAQARRADAAIPRLKKLAAASPRDYDVRLFLGEMLMAQRDFAAAQTELEAAAALRPDLPNAWVDLANDLYLQQNYTGTLAALDRVAKIAPETAWLDFLRAISLDKLGEAEGALESYQKFLGIAHGQYPDQEFQARQRVKVLEKSGGRRKR